VNHIDTSFSEVLKKYGCDEMYTRPYDHSYGTRTFVLRFGSRYMRLVLNQWDLMELTFHVPYLTVEFTKHLKSEIEDFLLTGKNEITEEELRTDSK